MLANWKARGAALGGLLVVLLNAVAIPLLDGGTADYAVALSAIVAVVGAWIHPSPAKPR